MGNDPARPQLINGKILVMTHWWTHGWGKMVIEFTGRGVGGFLGEKWENNAPAIRTNRAYLQ